MRHAPALVALFALSAFPAVTLAQPSVEFRVVERTGKMLVDTSSDPTFNFTVQARVVGGSSNQFLGNFAFDIAGVGEADANGSLSKLLISNADGTYAANPAQLNNNSVGRGGMAAMYTYLAGISPTFNGLINSSGGPFSNTPGSQEIGVITGSPTGGSLLLLTDTAGSGNPDTYSGSGSTAPIDPVIAQTYMGAGGNFVDLYRFKYTLTNFTQRQVTFTLTNLRAQIGSALQLSNGVWGPTQENAVATSAGVSVNVVPTSTTAATLGLAGLIAARRRRAA